MVDILNHCQLAVEWMQLNTAKMLLIVGGSFESETNLWAVLEDPLKDQVCSLVMLFDPGLLMKDQVTVMWSAFHQLQLLLVGQLWPPLE